MTLNMLNVQIEPSATAGPSAGRRCGSVMWRNRCHAFAPSTARGLVELARDRLERTERDDHHEREAEPRVRDDVRGERGRPRAEPRHAVESPTAWRIELIAPYSPVEHAVPHQRGDVVRDRPRQDQQHPAHALAAQPLPREHERERDADRDVQRDVRDRPQHGDAEDEPEVERIIELATAARQDLGEVVQADERPRAVMVIVEAERRGRSRTARRRARASTRRPA